MKQKDRKVWYERGLRFECTRCGACCRGEEGYVWVTDADIKRMARALGMDAGGFRDRYVREVGIRKSLKERPNGDCVMYRNGCRVYDARPPQCASWPFWSGNLESEETWRQTARSCPGIGRGPLYTCKEIRETATAHGYARVL